jgi:hypothetical protein
MKKPAAVGGPTNIYPQYNKRGFNRTFQVNIFGRKWLMKTRCEPVEKFCKNPDLPAFFSPGNLPLFFCGFRLEHLYHYRLT